MPNQDLHSQDKTILIMVVIHPTIFYVRMYNALVWKRRKIKLHSLDKLNFIEKTLIIKICAYNCFENRNKHTHTQNWQT